MASLDGRELGTVLTSAVGAMYTDGRLLYGLNGALYSQAFDTDRLKLTGEPRQVAPSVSQNWRASDTGVLVYRSAPQSDVQFTWVDRAGRRLATVGAPDSYTNFDVSPDGKRIAAGRRDPKSGVNSLSLIDVERGVTTPISPRGFSPNQKWIAYHSNQSGSDQVWVIPFQPNGEKWQISPDGGMQPRWSPDGNELFYLDADGRVVSVAMPGSDPRRAGESKPLFSTGLAPSNALDQFAVVGDRFLVRLPASSRSAISSPIEILISWTRR